MWLFEPCKTNDKLVSHITVLKEILDYFYVMRRYKKWQCCRFIEWFGLEDTLKII